MDEGVSSVDVLSLQLRTLFQKSTFFRGDLPILHIWIIVYVRCINNQKGYIISDQNGVHFLTFAVVAWVDVFTRKLYRDIVVDSLRHCQREKGLVIYAWCIMSNHMHLVVAVSPGSLSDVLRDFKKFTSKQLIAAIQNNLHESRRAWMLEIFKRAGEKNSRNAQYQFWQQDNHPKECYGAAFTAQKIGYVHNNPVAAGIVEKAEEYVYSSARDYYYGKKLGLLEIEWL